MASQSPDPVLQQVPECMGRHPKAHLLPWEPTPSLAPHVQCWEQILSLGWGKEPGQALHNPQQS